MNNGLHEVISGAAQNRERKDRDRPVPLLRAVVSEPAAVPQGRPAGETPTEPVDRRKRRVSAAVRADKATVTSPDTSQPASSARATSGFGVRLGDGGLRLAVWLCGFHEALTERRQRGERLSEAEELLLAMSASDFAGLQNSIIDMTLGRLESLVNAPEFVDDAHTSGTRPMEIFALQTLRNLSQRARATLRQDGPDAALALFGEAGATRGPLAIFQRVFTTALDMVEAFERMIPGDAPLLMQLAEALDSEVEKI